MFQYCGNNPIMCADSSGKLFGLIALGGLVIGALCLGGCAARSTPSSTPVPTPSKPPVSTQPSRPTPTPSNPSTTTSPSIDEKARVAVAQTIYGEERGYSRKYKNGTTAKQGQEAVAWTIINRFESPKFPNDWVSVVTQPSQFTGYAQGKKAYDNSTLEVIGWDYAYELAGYMVSGQYDNIPKPDGFTDKHMYFRTDTGQSFDAWGGITRMGGNVFFYYK